MEATKEMAATLDFESAAAAVAAGSNANVVEFEMKSVDMESVDKQR